MEGKQAEYLTKEEYLARDMNRAQKRRSGRRVAGTSAIIRKPNPKQVFDQLDDSRLEKGQEVSSRREAIWRSIEGGSYAQEAKKAARRAKAKRARAARRNNR